MQPSLSLRSTRPFRQNVPAIGICRRPLPKRCLKPIASLGPPDIRPYIDKTRPMNQQLTELREACRVYMNQLMDDVDDRAAGDVEPSEPTGARGGGVSAASQQLKEKIRYAVDAMQTGLVERDTEVRLLLLAALCSEHVLFIGPPGTAKSEIGRRLSKLIEGAYFERLLTRFSVPEELFGPLSMRALEADQYIRQTKGYLPEAEVAFIDEIFKANSAILNTLLTLLNERLYDNGSSRVRVPLITMVGASNELPESEELDALYDRFLLRKQVAQVSAGGLTQMLDYYAGNSIDEEDSRTGAAAGGRGNGAGASTSGAGVSRSGSMASMPAELQLTREDFEATRRDAVRRVRVPSNVIQLLADLRTYMQEKVEPPEYVSDRRLVKAVALMQVAAYCNGRDSVSEYDCLLLEHVLWQRPENAVRIADWLLNQLSADDGVKQVSYLLSGIFAQSCQQLGGSSVAPSPIKLAELQGEAAKLRELLSDKLVEVSRNLDCGFPVVLDNLWLGRDSAEALAAALGPKLSKTHKAVEDLLFEVVTLEVALQANTDAVTLANLMPKHWADFIRNAPVDEVKPIGTKPLRI